MKLRSILIKTLLGLLGLVMICVTVIIGCSFSDEALSPAAQKMLQIPAPTVPDASNGYFVLLGINAPKEADPLEAGIKVQATLDREYHENPTRTEYTQAPQTSGGAPPDEHCPLQGADCVDFYLKNKPALLGWAARQEVWRTRYARLTSLEDFEERPMLSAQMPLPSYMPMVRAAEMNLVSAVFAIDAGDAETGLAAIAGEIRWHRRRLAGSRMLISKMINVSMLRRDYQILSDVLEHWPELAQTHAQLLTTVLQPLDLKESDMRQVLEMENLFAGQMFLHLREISAASEDSMIPGIQANSLGGDMERTLIRFSYMPNATLNAAAPYWNQRAEAGSGSAATAETRKQKLANYYSSWSSDLNIFPWKYLRNPAGKLFLSIGDEPSTYFSYIERVHDLDGYIRLVSLQAALRREKIGKAAIPTFIQQAPSALRNPYNNKAMGWDAASSSLFFEGQQAATANPSNEKKVHRIKMAMN